MNREYAKQTIDEIIFLPSNSLSMYFVLPVPRGLNKYVPVLWKAGIPAYCSGALKSAFPVSQWHVGFKARKIRWRVRTGFTPVSLFTGLTEIFCHPTPYAFLCGRYSVIFTVIFLTEWVYHSTCILSIIIPWPLEKLTKKIHRMLCCLLSHRFSKYNFKYTPCSQKIRWTPADFPLFSFFICETFLLLPSYP